MTRSVYVFAVNKKWNMLLLLREWWSSVSSWCGLTPLPIASVVPVEVNDKLRHQVSMNTSHKWLHIFFIMCLATFSGNEIFCWINTHWATILVEIMKIFDSFQNILSRSVLIYLYVFALYSQKNLPTKYFVNNGNLNNFFNFGWDVFSL